MTTGATLRKQRSNENLYTCYQNVVDLSLPCDSSTAYEKMQAFCDNHDSEDKCTSDVIGKWCEWKSNSCTLKDTGMLDLVKPTQGELDTPEMEVPMPTLP